MLSSRIQSPRTPVRSISICGRPLPVNAVACSPGPRYNLPGGIGTTGPMVTMKHRHSKDGDLIPMPGPGEYNPDSKLRWKNAPGYSFGGSNPKEDIHEEGKRCKPAMGEAITASEPGPGHYANDSLDISKKPSQLSGWRVSKLHNEDPRRFNHSGASIGTPAPKERVSKNIPGPGSYSPQRDNRGHRSFYNQSYNKTGTMKPPARSEKRTEDMAAPGPGAYDTSRFDMAKQAAAHPTTMAGRPFETEDDPVPGPGYYNHSRITNALRTKSVHGPKFRPVPPNKSSSIPGSPGPGEYEIMSTIAPPGSGATIKHRRTNFVRSPRCPHQRGEVVGVMLSSSGPVMKATIKETWPGETEASTSGYRVVFDGSVERDIGGHQVTKWHGGVGPGAYDPVGGMGKWGPRYTIQGPSPFTSMAVSESRKTRDNPGPSQYFKDGRLPRAVGTDSRVSTMGSRTEIAQRLNNVGPGGGASGVYNPKYDFQPYPSFAKGVSLSFRSYIEVRVIAECDEVQRLCEEAGIVEWKGGGEWRSARQDQDDMAKDDYCGKTGAFIQQGGLLRVKAHSHAEGPNRLQSRGQSFAPWLCYSNKSKDSIRIQFEDGTIWTFPPAAVQRHGIPFDQANQRWPLPLTNTDGGPATYSQNFDCTQQSSPTVTICGRAQEVPAADGPGPGQYDIPSGLSVCYYLLLYLEMF